MFYMAKKVLTAVVDSLRPKRKNISPKLIMTLLVKNEELRLEHNILFHKAMGVDEFIITDNNSTDSTPQIIQKYVDKGWVVESIKEPGSGHRQKVWVDRMIWSAKNNHSADWVINADADEMWYSPSNSLKEEMTGADNILKCRVVNVYPKEGCDWWEWDEAIHPIPKPEYSRFDLSPFHVFKSYTYKTAHTARGYIKISEGNHKVTMLPSRKRGSEITIYHYNILSQNQFVKKMREGGEQIKRHPRKSVATHWRYFYGLYEQGLLEAEYERVIGRKHIEDLRKDGYIYPDNHVAQIFKEIFSA